MEEERISVGPTAQERATVLNQVLAGSLTLPEGAAVLGLSVRQLKRLKRRYRQRGPAALLHGNRGRPPWQAVPLEQQARIRALAQGRYLGFNHQHLTEMLQEHEQLPFHRTTVRRILLAAGLRTPRCRRRCSASRKMPRAICRSSTKWCVPRGSRWACTSIITASFNATATADPPWRTSSRPARC